uniref:DUF1758 domain-containing protein n=1 Tax=Amphimedon queenslandica TaxID=400682 RepID=A0A1X7TU85_AMPQE
MFNPSDLLKQAELHFIHDSGSLKSYITEQVCCVLSLATRAVKTLSIVTFGSTKLRNHPCKEVRLRVQTIKGGTL